MSNTSIDKNLLLPYGQHAGQLTQTISSLTSTFFQEVNYPTDQTRPPLKDMVEMLERDPVASSCAELKAMRSVLSFGDYSHPNKKIERYVQANINNIDGSWKGTLSQLFTAMSLGFSVAELVWSNQVPGYRKQWRLKSINILDPTRVGFKGRYGNITHVRYNNGDGTQVFIPYEKCLHITQGISTSFDRNLIWGVGDAAKALNFYKLKKIVLTEFSLAAKNNSTGVMHAASDNDGSIQLLGPDGKPLRNVDGSPKIVTKQEALMYQLQEISNKDYIITDQNTKLELLYLKTNENFWEFALTFIDKSICKAFGVPPDMFEGAAQGLGNTGLSQNHKSIVDSTINAMVTRLKEAVIENIVRRIIEWNFDKYDHKGEYGEFTFDVEEDPAVVNGRITTLLSAVSSGVFSAADKDITLKIRKDLGVGSIDDADKEQLDSDSIQDTVLKYLQKETAIKNSLGELETLEKQLYTLESTPDNMSQQPGQDQAQAQAQPQQQVAPPGPAQAGPPPIPTQMPQLSQPYTIDTLTGLPQAYVVDPYSGQQIPVATPPPDMIAPPGVRGVGFTLIGDIKQEDETIANFSKTLNETLGLPDYI